MLSRVVQKSNPIRAARRMSNSSKKPIKYLLFDLDGCLYSADSGYVAHSRKQLFQYIWDQGWVTNDDSSSNMTEAEKLKAAETFWRPLFTKYNQTYRGLKAAGLDINWDDYWSTCRKGTADWLSEDQPLRSLLDQLPQRKFVVSNCNETEVIEALDCLGITDCFERIYGAKAMLPYCKPEKEAFQKIIDDIGGGITPQECCMFEDSYKNLVTCDKMGMETVFVLSEIHVREEGVSEKDREMLSAVVPTLSEASGDTLRAQLPRLFSGV